MSTFTYKAKINECDGHSEVSITCGKRTKEQLVKIWGLDSDDIIGYTLYESVDGGEFVEM